MNELEKLIEAAKRGDLADVKSVLESHLELLHERDQSGATALHYATFAGHRSVVGELVRQGADIIVMPLTPNSGQLLRVGDRIPESNGWIPRN